MPPPVDDSDEPLTPAGRLFLQPETNQVIHCVVGVKNALDVDSMKSQLRDSLMLKHPRFTSIMVRDNRGFEHWRRTEIDINRHLLIIDHSVSSAVDDQSAINEYLAELTMDASGLSTDKPLWEIHVLMAHKCAIFRIHHSLGDGISLMSLLLASCRKVNNPEAMPSLAAVNVRKVGGRKRLDWRRLWGFAVAVWFGFLFVIEFILRLCVRDRKTAISGGAGVELWPRKIATARFWLDDMKVVKRAVPYATINDVLFAIISSGLSRYLDHRAPNEQQEGRRITGLAMVNLRQQQGLQDLSKLMRTNSGARWGNQFGLLLLPVYYHNSESSDPLEYLKRAKAMIDRKKQSCEAHFSYKIGELVMSVFGAKAASWLNYRILCNTSFVISNMVGPQEEIMIGGNPITFLRAANSALPHALVLSMVSYAGRADMQVQVAKDIIPDPKFLAKCLEDALHELKEQAMAKI